MVLIESSLYLQTSQWKIFSISIVEAMHLGVTCAIADTLSLADLFEEDDLELVFSSALKVAASQLMSAFEKPSQFKHWPNKAKAFVKKKKPGKLAQDYISFYGEVL